MADAVQILVIVVPVAVILYAIFTSLRIVRPTEKGLVERFGKYHRFVEGDTLCCFLSWTESSKSTSQNA